MLAAQQPAVAQNHRSTPRTAAQAKSSDDTTALEAFSDTTGTSSVVDDTVQSTYSTYHVSINQDDVDPKFFGIIDSMFESLAGGMMLALIITVIIFVIAPLVILFLIFYFIYKYRKQKLQLAETAMKTGQPIPTELAKKPSVNDEDAWAKGVKKVALGAGLIACCWILDFELGIAAGYIFFFYGLGLMVIAKTTTKKKNTPLDINDEEDTSLSNRDETPINN